MTFCKNSNKNTCFDPAKHKCTYPVSVELSEAMIVRTVIGGGSGFLLVQQRRSCGSQSKWQPSYFMHYHSWPVMALTMETSSGLSSLLKWGVSTFCLFLGARFGQHQCCSDVEELICAISLVYAVSVVAALHLWLSLSRFAVSPSTKFNWPLLERRVHF